MLVQFGLQVLEQVFEKMFEGFGFAVGAFFAYKAFFSRRL